MPDHSSFYAVLLFFSGCVGAVAFAFTWKQRKAPGGMPLLFILTAIIVWTWTYALHWLFPDKPAHFFWLDVTYIGAVMFPVSIFVFAAQISGRRRWISKPFLYFLVIEPILTLVVMWSDSLHHLFYGGFRAAAESKIFSGGPWFWINVLFSYTFILISFIWLILFSVRSRGSLYRKQNAAILIGIAIPVLFNVINIFGVNLLPDLDLTPVLFMFTGLFFTISLVTFRILDIKPVALDVLIDQMQDGMIVLDHKNRIVEANRAAAQLLGMRRSALIGRDFKDNTPLFSGLEAQIAAPQSITRQIALNNPQNQVLDVQVTPLRSTNEAEAGCLITWRDVTALKNVEESLRKANDVLSGQLKQIEELRESLEEQVNRDPLTGLFNRRFLKNALTKDFARAERSKTQLYFLLIDLDHFKQINDQYGHDVGDMMLIQVSRKIEAFIREGDWIVRYGGDEFLAVMMDMHHNVVMERTEHLRKEIENISLDVKHERLSITVSIGVAGFPEHGREYTEIFRAADQALYQAKAAGRNRVVCAPSA